jgi:hypothetical protein
MGECKEKVRAMMIEVSFFLALVLWRGEGLEDVEWSSRSVLWADADVDCRRWCSRWGSRLSRGIEMGRVCVGGTKRYIIRNCSAGRHATRANRIERGKMEIYSVVRYDRGGQPIEM